METSKAWELMYVSWDFHVIQMEVSLELPSAVVPQRDLHEVSGSMNTAHLEGFVNLLK